MVCMETAYKDRMINYVQKLTSRDIHVLFNIKEGLVMVRHSQIINLCLFRLPIYIHLIIFRRIGHRTVTQSI